MDKKRIFNLSFVHYWLWLMLLLGILSLSILIPGEGEGRTITVDDDGEGEYTKIQDAVNVSAEGDTIRVWEGTYFENVVVDKGLDIVGNGSGVTTIDAGGNGDVVRIEADGTNLSGFRVSGSNDYFFYAGIRIDSNRSSVFSNELIQNNRGMYFSPGSHDNMIEDNMISSNLIGMSLHESMNNMITGNTCSNNTSTGISLRNSSYNTFTDNTCSDNKDYGISLGEFSNNNTISYNTCLDNNRSLRFFDSYHNRILNNRVKNTFFECILIKDSGYNLFTNNTIESPYKGFDIIDSHHITLERTIMIDCGIDIDGSALKYWNTHSIDTTNLIHGNPVVYLKDATNLTIPEGAGEVILANCTSIIVDNQNCSNINVGIQIGYSKESYISNNTCWNNQFQGIHLFNSDKNIVTNNSCEGNVNYGIELENSNHNLLVVNSCTNNKHYGTMLDHSHNNTLSDNLCLDNGDNGITLTYSDHNVLFNNTSSNNWRGIYLSVSKYNTINFNTCSNNSGDGLWICCNGHNTFSDNIVSENDKGIYIADSESNIFTGNSFSNNSNIGIVIKNYSKENYFTNNTVSGNRIGFEFLFYSSDNIVHSNNIFDNREYGIHAENNNGQVIEATINWWGDDSGPFHPTRNPEGTGDTVTDNVEFDPWIEKKTPDYPGIFRGYVQDTEGRLLDSAHVEIECADEYNHTYTDDYGYFRITDIPKVYCYWTITISKGGYEDYVFEDALGGDHIWEFKLEATPLPPAFPGSLSGFVKDRDGIPLETVLICIDCGDEYNESYTDISGYYRITNIPFVNCSWTVTASKEGYDDSVVVMVIRNDSMHNFILEPHFARTPDDDFIPPLLLPLGVASLGLLGLFGFVFLREDLRFLLLSFLTLPLYTKLEKNDILDQPKRQDIYSYIVKKPGSNLTRLHNALPVGYGTLVHHLKVLEREKHIRSKKEMGRKMFYPTGTDWARKMNSGKMGSTSGRNVAVDDVRPDVKMGESGAGGRTGTGEVTDAGVTGPGGVGAGGGADSLESLSSMPVGLNILEFLEVNGPATQGEIVKALNLKQTTVSHSIRKLEEEGKVKGSGEKRGAVYRLKDE